MNAHKEGWFTETNDFWPGIAISLEVNKVLYDKKSDYQEVLVVETKGHGKALILDGAIQCTESDEFSYQEGIAFFPLCSHPNPENVLIIGGGDDGVAFEVAKHAAVKKITQVEIDPCVVEAAKQHLPSMFAEPNDPKVTLLVQDGYEYMKNHENEFDVIITDSSDPVGPSQSLYKKSYFQLMKRALKAGGIIAFQSGFIWADLDHVSRTLEHCRSEFPVALHCTVAVPTMPTGQIGIILGSLNPDTNFEEPLRVLSDDELDEMKVRYYSPEIHRAAFALPRFAVKRLRAGAADKKDSDN